MERIYKSYKDFEGEYKDFSYVPENAENGEAFTWKDLVEECLGNITYAQELTERDLWTYPSTVIDEDIREGAIVFNEELGTLDFDEEECGEIDRCVYDEEFFDPGNMLYS